MSRLADEMASRGFTVDDLSTALGRGRGDGVAKVVRDGLRSKACATRYAKALGCGWMDVVEEPGRFELDESPYEMEPVALRALLRTVTSPTLFRMAVNA